MFLFLYHYTSRFTLNVPFQPPYDDELVFARGQTGRKD